jgi:putative ABC transport system substrate-binding protein
MRRREFITILGGAMAACGACAAGRADAADRCAERPCRERSGRPRVAAFQEGLQKLGWTEGRNVRIDVRWGKTEAATMQWLASELVAQQPDLIVTQNSRGTAL